MIKLSGHPEISVQEFFRSCFEYSQSHNVDWDYYGKGSFKQEFEQQIAGLLGYGKGLFLPSGVMAQLIAMQIALSKLDKPHKVGLHPTSHLLKHESDSYKVLHQLDVTIIGESDRVITVKDLECLSHQPKAVILEVPYRHLGGDMPSWDELEKIKAYCRDNQIFLHLDGARIWETQSYYQKSLKEICQGFDSAYVSFYKGIGSTSGAMLLSHDAFIEEAKIWNRRHGGDLFNLMPLLLPAKINFDRRIERFSSYFAQTQRLYDILGKIDGVSLQPLEPKSNMFHMHVRGNPETLIKRNQEIADEVGVSIIKSSWGEKRQGWTCVEIYVGDNASMVSGDQIREYFAKLHS